jgi:dipeptidase E
MAIAKRMKLKNGTRRIVAAGRGRVIQSPVIRSEILKLVPKQKAPIHVVYLGTATYESTEGYNVQAAGFTEVGCTVEHLKLTHMRNSKENREMITQSLKRAQIVAVSGGNTLFALKKWRSLGVDKLLRNAMDDGVVLCGGSAGAICWFDAGHSDSRDPTTLLHVDPKYDFFMLYCLN